MNKEKVEEIIKYLGEDSREGIEELVNYEKKFDDFIEEFDGFINVEPLIFMRTLNQDFDIGVNSVGLHFTFRNENGIVRFKDITINKLNEEKD